MGDDAYSLRYFDSIFEEKGESYRELLQTLVDMLDQYAQEYAEAVQARDEKNFSLIRHKNLTLLENLELDLLKQLQLDAKTLIARNAPSAELQANVENFQTAAKKIATAIAAHLEALKKKAP